MLHFIVQHRENLTFLLLLCASAFAVYVARVMQRRRDGAPAGGKLIPTLIGFSLVIAATFMLAVFALRT